MSTLSVATIPSVRLKLSGSTDGKGIKITATSIGSGVTIHTADALLTDFITLYAVNSDTASIKLTLGWGGTTDPDDLIEAFIPSESGLVPVAIALPLTNSLIVKASAATASMIVLFGEVWQVG